MSIQPFESLKRPKAALWWAVLGAALLFFLTPQQAAGAFHLMRIDEVMAGADGDASIQFVELQMETSGQNIVSGHTIQFYNSAGAQTGTFIFSSNVSNFASGASILIGTTAFASASSVAPDFTMSSDIMAPDGRVCFETWDCVAYGNFTGSNAGYGSPAAALPFTGNSSLKRAGSTDTNNNASDFSLSAPAPRNNANETGTFTPPPAAPAGLTAADRPNDSGGAINLTWTPSTTGGVTEQRLYRGTTSGSHSTLVTTFNDNTTGAHADTGLTDGITYFYVVRSFDGTSESADSNEASAQPVDNFVPTGLAAIDSPDDQGGAIDLTWTPSTSTDVTEQRLYRSTTSGGSYSLVATSTTSTSAYTDAGLSNGVTYFYVVRSFDGAGESADPNEASAAPVDNLAPQPPTVLTAVDRPNDQGGAIDLTWTPSASADVTEQRIYRSTTSGSYTTPLATTTSPTGVYTDDGLTDGTTYFYVVRSIDGTSESADCNEASAVPIDNVAPQPPTALTAADTPADQGGVVDLTWTPSTSTDVTEQRQYRATTSGGYTTPERFFVPTASFFPEGGLTDGTTYYYIFRAFDGTNESADSNEVSATPVDNLAPQPPTALTAVDRPNDAGGVIDLAWTLSISTDVIEQRLYRGTTTGSHPTLVATSTNAANAHTDTGLSATTTYYYVVRAFDGTSESADSNEASAVPLDDPPAAPTGLTAADRPDDEGGAIDLTWTPSTSADVSRQRVYRGTSPGGPYSPIVEIISTTATSFTDTGLTDGATYYYVVRAFDGTSESANSNESSAVPIDNLAPAPPTGLAAGDTLNDRCGAIDLSWSLSTSTDVTQQRLYRGITSGSHPTLVATFSSTTSTFTDTGRTDGVIYYYVVTAFDATTESAASNEASAVATDDLALAVPGLSDWGLIALTGLLASAILWRIRRAGIRGVRRTATG